MNIDPYAMFALSKAWTERNAFRAELERAKRSLLAGGYTDLGGQDWQPPIGPSAEPMLDKLDLLRAERSTLLRKLDAARAGLREAVELLRAYRTAWFTREEWVPIEERADALLEKHKETP